MRYLVSQWKNLPKKHITSIYAADVVNECLEEIDRLKKEIMLNKKTEGKLPDNHWLMKQARHNAAEFAKSAGPAVELAAKLRAKNDKLEEENRKALELLEEIYLFAPLSKIRAFLDREES